MPDVKSTDLLLPVKTGATIALLLAFLWLIPQVPAWKRFGGLPANTFSGLLRVPAPAFSSARPGKAALAPAKAPTMHGTSKSIVATSHPIRPEIPNAVGFGSPMRHFYSALAKTARKEPGAITRVLHYGDSPVTADSITADVRALLQKRFGDAGHGFVLIAKPWAWYGHHGIDLKAQGWKIEAATMSRASDGFHGLGGVSFRGNAGATSFVRLPDDGYTSAEVQYLQQPGGGTFSFSAGDQVLGSVQTDALEKKPAWAHFDLPVVSGEAHSREMRLTVTAGSVRAFGYNFEKPGPGVIYSSLGLNGGQVQAVVRFFAVSQWTDELQHARPDLVVVNYGTNESVYPEYIEKQYPDELRKMIERIRAAVPEASILIMSPMDRGERTASGDVETVPILPRIVEIQKQTAASMDCAFFDTFDAMGGSGTMAKWYAAQPRLVSADFMHPFPAGAARVGALADSALVQGFEDREK